MRHRQANRDHQRRAAKPSLRPCAGERNSQRSSPRTSKSPRPRRTLLRRASSRGGRPLPHARYGVDLARVPDTYIEPFVAYRAWNWTTEGITSLNGALWTPKVAFEATCPHADDLRSMQAASGSEAAKKFWEKQAHHVPDPDCTCGMYAGINMQHLIDISYIQRGIHGEVHLWGRLYRHTLGWRAQYAYPKLFRRPGEHDSVQHGRRRSERLEDPRGVRR